MRVIRLNDMLCFGRRRETQSSADGGNVCVSCGEGESVGQEFPGCLPEIALAKGWVSLREDYVYVDSFFILSSKKKTISPLPLSDLFSKLALSQVKAPLGLGKSHVFN